MRVLDQTYRETPVTELHELPKNARRGDEEFLKESMATVGFFGAVLADARPGPSSGAVLVGNHRFRVACREGAEALPTLWVTPDDDDHALRISLADNASTDRSGYDQSVLAALLKEAASAPPALAATGYTDEALQALLASLLPPGSGGDRPHGPNLQERFGVPPFSVLDARAGYWKSRKRQWLSLGFRGDAGRGDSLDAEVATHTAHAGLGGLNQQIAPNPDRPGGKTGLAAPNRTNEATAFHGDAEEVGGSAAARQRRKATSAAPGGAAMPIERSRAEAAHPHKSQARQAALMKTGDSSLAGPDGRRMTWAAGTRPLEELDDTSARNAGASSSGASMFDPVLCELMLRWFAPRGGRVIDCFAGGCTLGIVATALGYSFTGVEIRKEQIAANEQEAARAGVSPQWVLGDSAAIDEAMPGGLFDFALTDPPYYDLEFYSSDPANGSAKRTYAEFLEWYGSVLTRTAAVLKDDRFMVVKIGEARDARGGYVNIVGDTTAILMRAGLTYYNEAILITAIGSLPVRAGRPFVAARKLGKAHQNVLIFCKGDVRRAVEAAGPVSETDWADLVESEPEADAQ